METRCGGLSFEGEDFQMNNQQRREAPLAMGYFDSPSADDAAASVAENKACNVYRGRRRRRDDAWSSVGTDSVALDGESAEICIQHHERRNNRFPWSATGFYLVSLIFLTFHSTVETSMLFETKRSVENLRLVEQPPYRHGNLRHRRLNQERERGDDRHGHATSYAQRHYTSGNQHYYYGNGYGFMEQQDTDEVHRRYNAPKTNLSDVWLCLLTTLGWTVWLFSSIESRNRAERTFSGVGDELDERFACPQGSILLVKGHVRQVTRANNDSMGYNIPTYTAVIDYMIESEKTHESLQIRKHFETQHALEQGFANVELLVLPDEPTHSVLKEDFEQHVKQEKEMQMLEQEREKRSRVSSFEEDADDDPLGDILEGGYCNRKCKRMTVVLAAFLVLASIGGTLQVVLLMEKEERWKGWLSFSFGLVLLVPVALVIHRCTKSARGWNESSEKQGYIIHSSTTMNGSVVSPSHVSAAGGAAVIPASNTSLSEACMPPSCGELVEGLCDTNSRYHYTEAASYVVPEMGGCYFVRYNKRGHHTGVPTSPTQNSVTMSQKLPNKVLPNKLTPPVEGSTEEDGIVQDHSSTSTVSSLSSEDHVVENMPGGTWTGIDDST